MGDDVPIVEEVAKIVSEKMLMDVGSQFGRNNQEYEMAGGSRRKGGSSCKASAPSVEPSAPADDIATRNGSSAQLTGVEAIYPVVFVGC